MFFTLETAVLARFDVDASRSIDDIVTGGNDAATKDVDVAMVRFENRSTSNRKLSTGDSIKSTLAIAFVTVHAKRRAPFAGIQIEAAAFAAGAFMMLVAGKAKVDVVFGIEDAIAFC